MKLHLILFFVFATLLYARDEIQVIPCESAIGDDVALKYKMIGKVLLGLQESPNSWVCAYSPCDFQRRQGWFAIKKDRTVLFNWDAFDDSTTTWYYDEVDDVMYLNTITYNKYGVKKRGAKYYTASVKKEYDALVDSFMMERDCQNKPRQNTVTRPFGKKLGYDEFLKNPLFK